jgi:hypothetical protein
MFFSKKAGIDLVNDHKNDLGLLLGARAVRGKAERVVKSGARCLSAGRGGNTLSAGLD